LSLEKGKFRPKADKKAALVALTKLKKREVKRLLSQKAEEAEENKPESKPARKRPPRKRVARKGKPPAKGQRKARVSLMA
jgi:hypothetical protein